MDKEMLERFARATRDFIRADPEEVLARLRAEGLLGPDETFEDIKEVETEDIDTLYARWREERDRIEREADIAADIDDPRLRG